MTRTRRRRPVRSACRRHNCCCLLITAAAAAGLYLNFDVTPAGAEPAGRIDTSHLTAAVAPIPAEARAAAVDASSPFDADPPTGLLQGKRALLLSLLLLERGMQKLAQIPDYTATFAKQERIDGELGESQAMQIKVRHEPFSVYMKWIAGDVGRELLYVDGQNEGKLLVKVGGIRGKLLPPLKLDPGGALALKESRYPVTKAGLLELARELVHYRRKDLETPSGVCCHMLADQSFGGRECYAFLVEYQDRRVSELYRKSLVLIDKELSLPVMVTNYTWPTDEQQPLEPAELDAATLIEVYSYSNIELTRRLADADFDRENKDYRFARK